MSGLDQEHESCRVVCCKQVNARVLLLLKIMARYGLCYQFCIFCKLDNLHTIPMLDLTAKPVNGSLTVA